MVLLMKAIKKIVVIGPESTGKSTLCAQLATHYKTTWCPEYAREYLLDNGTNYTYADLLKIAKGQLHLEDEFTSRSVAASSHLQVPLLFVDTDMYVMKVWCEFVYGKCHRFILDQVVSRKYDLYLFCNIDLPWIKDELREYPDLETRKRLFGIYKDIMINQPVPWVLISGNYEERSQTAIEAIDLFLE
jgi:NadR type nicotinamide-nucleotide adenylyltransferase